MALPLRHALQRAGRIPGRLVGPRRRDRVVDIADGAHARHQADLVTRQLVRIAHAIDSLVVVQADVQCRGGHLGAVLQQFPAALRVAAHHIEFGIGQGAGLVQHLQRHLHLADIVQQTGQARLAGLGVGQPHMARQRHHQAADGHRVHIGVVVARLEPCQADEGRRVARQRGRNLLDDGQATFRVDRVAESCLVEQRDHRDLRTLQHLSGATHFVFEPGPGLLDRRRSRRGRRRRHDRDGRCRFRYRRLGHRRLGR
mmetsp:Transcript_119891/g.333488  ORF Transcript_119891/g.333488 Transcript_119891/m.333488 type:complete len:256 (-) Transcript_119891:2364-3131(-)